MQTTVLVTGATGFIGSALVPRLEQAGYRVLRAARSLGQDLRRPEALDRFAAEPVGAVIHLAARSFVPDSWSQPGEFYADNVLGTQHVLEFCRRSGARMLYVSGYLYGIPVALPMGEDHPVVPSNPYAHSKWLGEELCRFYARAWSVPVLILRPFNLIGTGQDARFLVPQLVAQLRRGGEIVVNDERPRRDYLYLDDFIAALLAALAYSGPATVFNLGSGVSHSVREVIEELGRAAARPVTWRARGEARPHEIPDMVADCAAARAALGWAPRHTLGSALRLILAAEG